MAPPEQTELYVIKDCLFIMPKNSVQTYIFKGHTAWSDCPIFSGRLTFLADFLKIVQCEHKKSVNVSPKFPELEKSGESAMSDSSRFSEGQISRISGSQVV